jgi:hypothetical protein
MPVEFKKLLQENKIDIENMKIDLYRKNILGLYIQEILQKI